MLNFLICNRVKITSESEGRNKMSEHELAMPFTNVKSKGGIFDDASFVAGYEMGLLDATLKIAQQFQYVRVDRTIRADNVYQAELLGMHYGYYITASDNPDDEWSQVVFYIQQ